jgi:hypothetical protein
MCITPELGGWLHGSDFVVPSVASHTDRQRACDRHYVDLTSQLAADASLDGHERSKNNATTGLSLFVFRAAIIGLLMQRRRAHTPQRSSTRFFDRDAHKAILD